MDSFAVQRALVARGFDVGRAGPNQDGVDGSIGPRTRAALRAFQRARGLAVTGEADSLTKIALAAPLPIETAGPMEVDLSAKITPVVPLDARYSFLIKEAASLPILAAALPLHGVRETKGAGSNPTILGWARETGLSAIYRDDATPWCGLFAAVVVKRAGYAPVKDPLWALNWRKFGTAVPVPKLGDVLAFSRTGGGHVGFYVGEDGTHFHVLGGNQGDAVSIIRLAKSSLRGAASPFPPASAPASRRIVSLAAKGTTKATLA